MKPLSKEEKHRLSCESKKAFRLKVLAETKALSIMNHPVWERRSHCQIYVYQCPHCHLWHLTSSKGNHPIQTNFPHSK